MNGPHDDEDSLDLLVDLIKDVLYAIGLIAFGAALALGAVYFATQEKQASVTTQDCGSKFCKDKEGAK